jgi:acetyltransferase-like isoleucine patch superfamily enzyme
MLLPLGAENSDFGRNTQESMSALPQLIWQACEKKRLAMARLRSYYFGLLGANVGSKCLFGHGVRVDRPWTTQFGSRCVLEPDVWFDVVDDDAEVHVGNHVFFGRGTHLLISRGVTIGDHCLIGDGTIISDHKHNALSGELIEIQGCHAAQVTIWQRCAVVRAQHDSARA